MLNNKKYKPMKHGVLDSTASGIGFFEGILKEIPEDTIMAAIYEISKSGWLTSRSTIPEIKNMVVTESIRLMTYQEFKEVAPYLFSYSRNQRQKGQEFIVQTVEITEVQYEDFQNAIRELMGIKQQAKDVIENVDVKYGYKVYDLQAPSKSFMDYAAGYSLEKILNIRWTDYLYTYKDELQRDNLEGQVLDSKNRPDWFDQSFVEHFWGLEITPLSRDEAVELEVNEFKLSEEEQKLKEIAEEQIAYLKKQDLWEIGAVDYYEFGYMPTDLIDCLLEDGAYGNESDRADYEVYFGWFKGGGEVCNTIIAMPGTSFLDDVILGDISLSEEFKEELDETELDKVLKALSQIEKSELTDLGDQTKLSRRI